MKLSYKGIVPKIAEDVYIAPGAQIIGKVEIEKGASVWPNAVIRGDMAEIIIGKQTNIQDNTTLHVDKENPLVIGNQVTIGHNAILHGCTIGDKALIGMGAIILNGAVIGKESLIGAGTLIPPGKEIPPHSLVVGSPGQVKRQLTNEEIAELHKSAETYAHKAQVYQHESQVID